MDIRNPAETAPFEAPAKPAPKPKPGEPEPEEPVPSMPLSGLETLRLRAWESRSVDYPLEQLKAGRRRREQWTREPKRKTLWR